MTLPFTTTCRFIPALKETNMANSPIAAESAPGFLTVAPQFTVPDVVAAASYYCDILGFENRGFFGDPPTRDGTKIPANTFHPLNDPTDVFGLFYPMMKIQQIALSSKQLLYDYGRMLDELPL